MLKQPQGSDAIEIAARPEVIWNILTDSTNLPNLMPMVKSTTGEREVLDSVRHCEVCFGSKTGQVTERCIVFSPTTRIGWILVQDSLGFSKMLDHMGFDFTLNPSSNGQTRVTNTTYYRPKNSIAALLSKFVFNRKFRQIRKTILRNIKAKAESVHSHNH